MACNSFYANYHGCNSNTSKTKPKEWCYTEKCKTLIMIQA